MKILAIRGENLASLPAVEIDLEAGPLADSRLFAITGPTGAGKSTLLDALCLALYDRVPRLVSAREAAGGELELPASDPRSVVRRGAAYAKAEVDFRDKDGKALRATWEAWRARRKASGKLQPQRVSLFALEGDAEVDLTGATKTETLSLIRDRVGLSFDEFRRAVLLAQGDFAAFLAAKPDERAALLERMTGTQLYARLSARAYERAKEEDQALRALEQSKEGLSLLEPAARAELEAQEATARARQATLDGRAEAARAEVTWYETRRRLEAETAAALDSKQRAQAAWQAAEPRRKDLALAKEAELLRPAQRALRTAEETEARAVARTEAAKARATAHRAALEAGRAAFTAASEKLGAVREEHVARAPDVARARDLDGALKEANQAAEDAEAGVKARLRAALAAGQALEGAKRTVEALAREAKALDGWLESQTATRIVAAQWPRWAEALERYERAHARARAAAEVDKSARDVLTQASRREREARARLEEVTRRIAAAQTERQALAARLAEVSAEASATALAQATALLAEHRANVETMKGLALDTRRAHTARRDAEEAKGAAEATLASEAEALERLALEQAELQSTLDEARAARALADAKKDLAARRTELLEADAPCPLCGSTHHPALAEPEGETPLAAPPVARLEAQLSAVEAARRGAAARHAQHEVRRAAAAEDAARADKRLEEARQAWSKHLSRLEEAWLESALLAKHGVQKIALLLPRAPKLTGSTTEVAEAIERLDRLREGLLEETEAQASLTAAIEACREKEEALQSRRGATQAEVDGAVAARAKSERTLSEAEAEVEANAAKMKEAVETLDAAFCRWPGWPERLEKTPRGFFEDAEARVETFEAKSMARTELGPRQVEADQAASLAAQTARQADEALEEAKRAHADRSARAAELAEARRRLLDGEAVETFEARLKARLEAAEGEAKAADEALREARQALAVAEAELESAAAATEEATRTKEAEAGALEAALARSKVPDRDALERMLDRGPGWLEALEAALAALDEDRVRAESTHADRAARLAAHLEGDAPELTEEEASAQLETTKADLQALVDELAALRARLTADDEARARLSDLAPRLSAQRARLELWSELSALIGSADGKKLRTFAQGLTLDVLVEQSNLHLKALRPRYTLRRVQGQAMELAVVDHDLGEEVRFISTLSGGERFLVSLALALGLSTLSSRNVRIESLFIDEGFGALDKDTLEIALATLDQLQAEGRTVGIISHVPDLADRIGYRVEVRPTGPGTSEVKVVGV